MFDRYVLPLGEIPTKSHYRDVQKLLAWQSVKNEIGLEVESNRRPQSWQSWTDCCVPDWAGKAFDGDGI